MARSAFVQSLVEHELVAESAVAELLARAGEKDFDVAVKLFDSLELPQDRGLLGLLYGTAIGKAHVPLDKTLFQPRALATLVPEMARKQQCIPLYLMGEMLTVAMPHPEDAAQIAVLSKLVSRPVSAVFAFPQEIESAIEIQYDEKGQLEQLSDELAGNIESPDEITPQQLKEFAAWAGVVSLVKGLLLYCVKSSASDIHIQPTAKSLDIRFRVDGRLQSLLKLNKTMTEPVMARLKVLAGINVIERRLPQDGRVSLELKDRSYDFRLSTVPTAFGEKAVVRAVGSSDKVVTPLDQLGLSRYNERLLNDLVRLPNGVLYVTGPTGSGKTTLLYSVLSKLNDPAINIVTAEDPVELRIDGITQIQANSAIDLDFARVLRAILRQDPQVVLIGEIRDAETARIASQAALTGHLVLTTLHTNNSFQAITRLLDMGLDAYLVAPSVVGVVAQRLVRRICTHCKVEYEPSEAVLDELFFNRGSTKVHFYRGRGCEACGSSGYAGRMAIHEIFVVTDAIRDMIVRRAPITEIRREAVRNGFRSMRHDGVMKAMLGLTTLDEVDQMTRVVRQA